MKSWSSLSVEDFLELREVENTSFDSEIDKMIEVISIVYDLDPVDVGEWDLDKLEETFDSLQWLYKDPPKNYKQGVEGYSFKGFDNMTLAEYIELTNYFAEDPASNLPLICAVLYRQHKTNEWGHNIIEPYTYNPQNRKEVFYPLPVGDVFGIIPEFIKWKDNFENTYAPLFEPEFEQDEDYVPDEQDKEEMKLEEEKKKFSWESFIFNLCNEDLTKTDQVLNLGLIYVFNMLAMRKSLGG